MDSRGAIQRESRTKHYPHDATCVQRRRWGLRSHVLLLLLVFIALSGRCRATLTICPELQIIGIQEGDCSLVNGNYLRRNIDWEGEALYSKTVATSDNTTTEFHVFHIPTSSVDGNITSGSWIVSESLGLRESGDTGCIFSVDSNNVDPATAQYFPSASNYSTSVAQIYCAGTTCFGPHEREGGCSCEIGTVTYDLSIFRPAAVTTSGVIPGVFYSYVSNDDVCTSGCCRGGECQDDNLFCVRYWVYGISIGIFVIVVVFGIVWFFKSGSCLYNSAVTPAPDGKHIEEVDKIHLVTEEYADQDSWAAELKTCEDAGLRMTWFAYGEMVEIPDFTIRDIVHARQGSVRLATKAAEAEAAHILRTLRAKLQDGGMSFLNSETVFGDFGGQSIGKPLIVRYVPYLEDELLIRSQQVPGPAAINLDLDSDSDDDQGLNSSSPSSSMRRTSFGGVVNGKKFLPPSGGTSQQPSWSNLSPFQTPVAVSKV